ncbi:MAG TPA: hypothetical protein V6C63_00810 [Allocoleopsis sp.]
MTGGVVPQALLPTSELTLIAIIIPGDRGPCRIAGYKKRSP